MTKTVQNHMLIDGEWTDASDGATMTVENPATNEIITTVPWGSLDDAKRAITAAERAQVGWAAASPDERACVLDRAYDLVVEHREDIARVITLEMGKPLADARNEVDYASSFLRWFAGEALRVHGDYRESFDGRNRFVITQVPVGPVVIVTPWNFPLAMGTRKLAPALAAGCAVVFKPAEQTPLTALMLGELLVEAGMPRGVVNIVTTGSPSEIVTCWMKSGIARKVSFTGSTDVGKILLRQSADHVLRTSLELGGNAAFVVLRDADLDRAVEGAVDAKMRNMGEACTAANRIFVDHAVADEFAERLGARLQAMKIGNGLEEGVEVGPLIDAAGREKVISLIADARSRGAQVVVGGQSIDGPGYFVMPTVLNRVTLDSGVGSTEIFGPLAPIIPFDETDDVRTLVNATSSGLAGYIFSQDIDHAWSMAEKIDVGMVGVNTGIVSNPVAPFGGVKQSGLGREGSSKGIDEFLEYKYLVFPKS